MEQHLSKNFDLKTVRSFYNAPTAKSGIFTTVGQSFRQNDARKSCIEHLPGFYHKVDLSGKLDFVVVFQTIQIERLSVEVENLRVMLKDSERQISNYLNYEVQIKELTESCHQLEGQVVNYQSELEKMSLACNALYEEGREAKRTFEREAEDMKREHSVYRNEMERQNQQLGDRVTELEELLRQGGQSEQQAQRKNKLISQQLVRLNQNLLLGQNQIGELRQNFAAKSRDLERCTAELGRWQQAAQEHQEKLVVSEQKRVKSEESCQRIKDNHEQLQRQFSDTHEERQKLQMELQNTGGYIQQTHKQLQNRGQLIENYKMQISSKEQELDKLRKTLDDCARQLQNQKQVNDKTRRQLDNLQRQTQNTRKELNVKDSNNKELKIRSEELARIIADLKSRIEQGITEIAKCKQVLKAYDAEFQEGAIREQQLQKQIAALQLVLQQNSQIKDMLFQINSKLAEKDDQIFAKDQHITDLTIENKELFHQGQSLKNNIETVNQNLQQLQSTIDRERQVFQNEKSKLTDQFQRILNNQKEERVKIQKELQKVKQEGLIQDSTKRDIQALKDTCQSQAQEIKNMNGILQYLPKIMVKLKQSNKQYKQVQNINNTLRKQLANSILMNEQLVDRMTDQIKQINSLMDQISALQQKLRYQRDKNDEFAMLSRNNSLKSERSDKTMISTQSTQIQFSNKSSSPGANYSTRDRFSPNQTNPINLMQRPSEKPFFGYDTGFRNGKSSIIGGIGNGDGLIKSAMIGEGVLYESKKVLQPSSYFPSRQSNEEIYKGNNPGYRESTFSSYEQFKRDRRI